MKAAFNWVRENVINYDLYGKQITFSFQGKSSFKTFAGGFLSLMIVVFMIIVTIILSIVLLKYGDTNKSTK